MRSASPTFEVERRSIYALLLIFAIPRVLIGHGADDGAVAMLAWSAMGFVLTRRAARIPRMIVVRTAAPWLRRWGNAFLLGLGRVPLASGARSTQPPWQVAPVPRSEHAG